MDKFWKVVSTRKGFEGKWIHINLDDIELPDKSHIEFEAIEFQRNGAGVVAEDSEGRIMLVKNYRYINDYYSWEVPAGTVPPNMDPADCVVEELKEEAGCAAKKEELISLGTFYPSIGSSTQLFNCFYAKNVKQVSGNLDANEILEAKWFSKDEIREMIRSGIIKDGFTIVLLLRVMCLL